MPRRLCHDCGYDLAGLSAEVGQLTCPECGTRYTDYSADNELSAKRFWMRPLLIELASVPALFAMGFVWIGVVGLSPGALWALVPALLAGLAAGLAMGHASYACSYKFPLGQRRWSSATTDAVMNGLCAASLAVATNEASVLGGMLLYQWSFGAGPSPAI